MAVVKVNNIEINYSVTGKGKPLLLIMGLNAEKSGWNSQVSFFKNNYQVITFDNRGSGKSSKPQGPYSMKMMADDAIGLMDSLGIDKAHVVGTSMGGMIAQEIAVHYPERILKLVLASTCACQDNRLNGATAEVIQAAQSSRKLGTVVINLAFNKPLNRFFIVLIARVRSKFTNAAARAAGKVGFKGQLEACLNHNTLERLHLIKAPTLVITGTRDRVIRPSSSEIIAGKITDSRLVKVEKGSHLFNMEMKREFNRQVLNFLKS